MADIVKFSDEDLAWFGESGDASEIARRWLDLGPKLILVTRGGEGATGYSATATVKVPARRVEVVDTVGAGDTFNAGVLAALDERGLLTKATIARLAEDDIRAALDLGVRAAAVTVSRAGANPPWRGEI
jgi:fructokinase